LLHGLDQLFLEKAHSDAIARTGIDAGTDSLEI
jgi:hypothetical protein